MNMQFEEKMDDLVLHLVADNLEMFEKLIIDSGRHPELTRAFERALQTEEDKDWEEFDIASGSICAQEAKLAFDRLSRSLVNKDPQR